MQAVLRLPLIGVVAEVVLHGLPMYKVEKSTGIATATTLPTSTPTSTPTVTPSVTATPVSGDSYEGDDVCGIAHAIGANGEAQPHTFHQLADVDWGLDSISKAGRLIITSTTAEHDAKASPQGAYFSDHFLTGLAQGFSVYTSFLEARRIANQVFAFQDAWVDGNGNRQPNELDDNTVASRGFNYPGTFDDPWPPHIFAVQPPTALVNYAGELRADVRDDVKVRQVWGIVYPPSYQPPPTGQELQPEVLPTFLFTDLGNNQFGGQYTGFTEAGIYRILVQAEDNEGLHARPVLIEVMAGAKLFLPLVVR